METKDVIDRLSFSLGYAIGDNLTKTLPTLSCDYIQTYNVIQVKYGEAQHLYKLHDKWFKSEDNSSSISKEWIEYKEYEKTLITKYIPSTHEYHCDITDIEGINLKSFKKGLIDALYECDCCNYSTKLEDIDIKVDYVLTITLKRRD
jgi:hypothetical protein